MLKTYIVGREMSREEKEIYNNTKSLVTKVEKIQDTEDLNLEALIEGLLYLVGEDGLKLEQVAATFEISLEDSEVLLDNIKDKYRKDLYGIELVNYGGKYKFVTKKSVYPYAQRLFNDIKTNSLSQSALETLAIIAYKQPITRIEIEELRGVGCDMMLRKLLARNLIKEVGRSEAPGRPILYEVTEEFMDSFKLYTLNELPDLPEYVNDENSSLF